LQHIKQEKEEDEDKGSSPFLFTIIKVKGREMKKEPLVSCSTSQSQPKPSFQLVTNNLENLSRVGGHTSPRMQYFKPFFYQGFSQDDSDTLKNMDTVNSL
jgi:hypothetical protein